MPLAKANWTEKNADVNKSCDHKNTRTEFVYIYLETQNSNKLNLTWQVQEPLLNIPSEHIPFPEQGISYPPGHSRN